jgi:hypothetical protein
VISVKSVIRHLLLPPILLKIKLYLQIYRTDRRRAREGTRGNNRNFTDFTDFTAQTNALQ